MTEAATNKAWPKLTTATSGGGFGSGLLALVVGLLLRNHFGPIKHVCDSAGGQFSQALSNQTQEHCGLDSLLAELGTVLFIGGIVLLATTLLIVVLLLVAAGASAGAQVEQAAPPTSSQARRVRFSPRLQRLAMLLLASVGLGAAGYLTIQHYGSSTPAACVDGCDKVTASTYAALAGVPVAVIGVLGYGCILVSLLMPQTERTRLTTAGLCVIGFAFSLYLTYRELFSLRATCQLCVLSAIVMVLLAVLGLKRFLRPDNMTMHSVEPVVSSATSDA